MRYRTNDRHPELDEPGTCFACGERADAVWRGIGATVEVCGGCATAVLPALICDAVPVATKRPVGDHEHHLSKLREAYWRAALCRMQDEVRRGEQLTAFGEGQTR